MASKFSNLETEESKVEPTERSLVEELGSFEEDFSTLIEPLFNAPKKLPDGTWAGHIPFMFVLMKLLRPRNYVELGVLAGTSLIAASTAASSYGIETALYGIDSWQGDEHAVYNEGDRIYSELKTYLDANFSNTTLMRCFFSEARKHFSEKSIDLLHIDGQHTYDSVKEDFTTWIDAMDSSGVILFHDICVLDRGFGVHRFWAELKESYFTLEFHHSYGLGVLFLNPADSRLAPLTKLASNRNNMAFYRNLVPLVAGALERSRQLSLVKEEVRALKASTSWKITAPLRALRRTIG